MKGYVTSFIMIPAQRKKTISIQFSNNNLFLAHIWLTLPFLNLLSLLVKSSFRGTLAFMNIHFSPTLIILL